MEENNIKKEIGKNSKGNKSIPHIIPKFYLEFFCNNNKITVFNKKTKPYNSSPYKIAKETKYYSLEKVPDYDKDLADAILTDTEGVVKNTHHKLIYKMEMDKDTLIYDMVAIGSDKKYIETLAKMNWTTIITTQNHPFITSDHPVSIFNAKHNFDLNEKDTNITFPLNSRTCLMLSCRTLPVVHPANVSNHTEIVMSINKRTLAGAYEQVYVGLTNIPIQNLLKEFGFIIQ